MSLISHEELARFPEIWKRVEASRPKLAGSAPLMPRKKKRPPIRIPPDHASPKNYKLKTIFSAFRG